ncbi:Sister chromatid cohesion protein PDS5 B [Nymphon striatum]|nr:Sister chromatid cohesion protein PDS5 B [Nymphon striatum]
MPKPDTKIVYPTGIREISEDLSTDDLVRRLKDCAQSFQNLNQDDNNSEYIPLSLHLASDHFLEHSSKDVRLLIACCIADVFRVFAPEAPYKDSEQLKAIFEFFINQLRGLEDPKDPAFKRYFYLLENLAWVKSFNICIELENSNAIFCQLYTLMFNMINDNHSHKVRNFMLDMMCPLISEADIVSQELLDIMLAHIIEPRKSQNKNAYLLAKDILKRTSSTVETYIQSFFNNAIILGKTSDSDLTPRLYDLIYELNNIVPAILLSVLPQLDFKLKSNESKERLDVTRLLARMFSDKDSELAAQNKPLWTCFLGRFNDISVAVRTRCVQYSMHFLLNHPELKDDISEQLKKRQHDPDENVRYEVVMAIISAAKKEFSSINDDLLRFVKERTLDKKTTKLTFQFKIRKEALLGLATLYKQHFSSSDLSAGTIECLSWIRNKVLHVYYQNALDDRLLVERILHTCLVPYNLPPEQRMQKLFQLYSCIDEHAVKAFNELLKCQNIVRNQVRAMIEVLKEPESVEKKQSLHIKVTSLSKSLPEQVKCQEYLKKFCGLMTQNTVVRSHMETIVRGDVTCREAESSVKEVLKACGMPVMTNSFYTTIKQLLERVAPMVIDKDGVLSVIDNVEKCVNLKPGEHPKVVTEILAQKVPASRQAVRGLQLLLTLTSVFPMVFQNEEVFAPLLRLLDCSEHAITELSLRIITNIGDHLENDYPNIGARLMPILHNFRSTWKCKAGQNLKNYLTLDSKYFRTALVSIGQIAYLCADNFGNIIKTVVYKLVVKDLLMVDKNEPRDSDNMWEDIDYIPEETRVKMEGMTMLVKWLRGLKNHTNSACSALRLLSTCVRNNGDLMEKGHISESEKSWLRLTAGTCILKLAQESAYAEIISHDQFQGLAALMKDECKEVRERFSSKLNKGLHALKLPLEYMGILSLAAHESVRELKIQARNFLWSNITKRRDYLKQHQISNSTLFSLLPDYVLPYAIHLLAHDSEFKTYDQVPVLMKIKDNLWFLMEPLMLKNENYSFSFFKRLIENIKQTDDAQNPNDEVKNKKLYAVCDLALSLVMSKTTNFILKEYPVEPLLPNKLYVNPDPTHGNTKSYLPPDFQFTVPKRSRMEKEMMMNKIKTSILQPKSNGTEANSNRMDVMNGEEESLIQTDQMPGSSKQNKEIDETKEASTSVDENSQISTNLQKKRGRGRPPRSKNKDEVVEVSTQTTVTPESEESMESETEEADSAKNGVIVEESFTQTENDENINSSSKHKGRPPKQKSGDDSNLESSSLPSPDVSTTTTDSGVVETKRIRRKPSKFLDEENLNVSSSPEDEKPEEHAQNKKKRGRPPKSKPGNSVSTSPPSTQSSLDQDQDQDQSQKRRGRPFTTKVNTSKIEFNSKSEDTTASMSSDSGPIIKRGRGRPKVNKPESESTILDIVSTIDTLCSNKSDDEAANFDNSSQEIGMSESKSSTKLKEADIEIHLEVEEQAPVKRKRGRPSKTQSPDKSPAKKLKAEKSITEGNIPNGDTDKSNKTTSSTLTKTNEVEDDTTAVSKHYFP